MTAKCYDSMVVALSKRLSASPLRIDNATTDEGQGRRNVTCLVLFANDFVSTNLWLCLPAPNHRR